MAIIRMLCFVVIVEYVFSLISELERDSHYFHVSRSGYFQAIEPLSLLG